MDMRLASLLAAAALLAGGVTLQLAHQPPAATNPDSQLVLEASLSRPRGAVRVAVLREPREECLRSAHMIHAVHWAAACMIAAREGAADGHPECDLPNDRAAVLNAQIEEAEARCHAGSD